MGIPQEYSIFCADNVPKWGDFCAPERTGTCLRGQYSFRRALWVPNLEERVQVVKEREATAMAGGQRRMCAAKDGANSKRRLPESAADLNDYFWPGRERAAWSGK
jgi:hypothetical protein